MRTFAPGSKPSTNCSCPGPGSSCCGRREAARLQATRLQTASRQVARRQVARRQVARRQVARHRAARRRPQKQPEPDDEGCHVIAAIGLLVGVVAGLLLEPTVPLWLQPYLPIAVVAALDAVFGGLRALLDGIFDDRVFIVSFLSNV